MSARSGEPYAPMTPGKATVRYEFTFRHEGAVCYEGDQSAVWMQTGGADVDVTAGLAAGHAPPRRDAAEGAETVG